jgi:hypothetical protein
MKRKIAIIFLVILLHASIIAPLYVFAVSYAPAPLYHRQEKVETVMKAGENVYLFHSGTNEIKSTIHADDILTVYRIDTSCKVKDVGKIRIISYIGETYLKGEVVEGEIKPDDIAKKGNVSCLVVSAGLCPN